MHPYRSHTCGALRAADAGQTARLSGWVHAKRDHGGLLFIDLRDHYGITQCVFAAGSPVFAQIEGVRPESVITVTGQVVAREEGTLNPKLPTGEIELRVADLVVQSAAEVLPMQVAGEEKFPEDIRLRYRFIDLRRDKIHRNMMLRSNVITSIRRRMIEAGFMEYQTPILTASSPEGARDFLVPARMHPGKFYALPQAPQQFKQLLMVAGFDRYFQIAPCFRDEAVARRSFAGRILSARLRNELRDAGGRVRHDRAGDRRRVRGIRRGPRRHAGAVPAHSLRSGDAGVSAPTSRICAIRCASRT